MVKAKHKRRRISKSPLARLLLGDFQPPVPVLGLQPLSQTPLPLRTADPNTQEWSEVLGGLFGLATRTDDKQNK